MRGPVDRERLEQFMEAFGRGARGPGRVYFTGGATATWWGWRPRTVDIDLRMDPEPAGGFELIRDLKDQLGVNVELASPADFLPPLPGWRERSEWIQRCGSVDFYHYDLDSQALAKIARGFEKDLADVADMLREGRVEPARLRSHFQAIRGELVRYPRIDERTLEEQLENALSRA